MAFGVPRCCDLGFGTLGRAVPSRNKTLLFYRLARSTFTKPDFKMIVRSTLMSLDRTSCGFSKWQFEYLIINQFPPNESPTKGHRLR